MPRCIVDRMLGGVVLADDTVTVNVARAIDVLEGFGGQGTILCITGLAARSALLRYGTLDRVTKAVILIKRLDAAGVDSLLQGQRSIRAKVFDQHAVPRWIVDRMLGGVVFADHVVTVDVTRAIGVQEGFARFGSRPIEHELVERAIDITRCELREITAGGVDAAT